MTCIHWRKNHFVTSPECTTGIKFQVFRNTFHFRCDKVSVPVSFVKALENVNLNIEVFGEEKKNHLIFHLLHAACKHLLPALGSCEIPVRMVRPFKYTMCMCICPSNVKCIISISTCTIGWTVILCTSCCAGSCTKLEAMKLNPLKRLWALALGGTPGESVEGRKWPHDPYKRSERNSTAPATEKVAPSRQQQILLSSQTCWREFTSISMAWKTEYRLSSWKYVQIYFLVWKLPV